MTSATSLPAELSLRSGAPLVRSVSGHERVGFAFSTDAPSGDGVDRDSAERVGRLPAVVLCFAYQRGAKDEVSAAHRHKLDLAHRGQPAYLPSCSNVAITLIASFLEDISCCAWLRPEAGKPGNVPGRGPV